MDFPDAARLAELILRIASDRDTEAFDQLYDVLAPWVKGWCCRRRFSADHADMIAQDVLMALWAKAGSYNPRKGPIMAWIYAIMRNRAITVKNRERHPSELLDPDAHVDPSPRPDEQLLSKERQEAIRAAMADLPEAQRVILDESYWSGRSQREIATRLGVREGTVKSRTRLGLKRIRDKLKLTEWC